MEQPNQHYWEEIKDQYQIDIHTKLIRLMHINCILITLNWLQKKLHGYLTRSPDVFRCLKADKAMNGTAARGDRLVVL